MLEVEVDDFANPEPAEGHAECHTDEEFGVIEQALGVVAIEEDHDNEQEWG